VVEKVEAEKLEIAKLKEMKISDLAKFARGSTSTGSAAPKSRI